MFLPAIAQYELRAWPQERLEGLLEICSNRCGHDLAEYLAQCEEPCEVGHQTSHGVCGFVGFDAMYLYCQYRSGQPWTLKLAHPAFGPRLGPRTALSPRSPPPAQPQLSPARVRWFDLSRRAGRRWLAPFSRRGLGEELEFRHRDHFPASGLEPPLATANS